MHNSGALSMASEPLDPDVVEARRLRDIIYAFSDTSVLTNTDALVALVEKVVKERDNDRSTFISYRLRLALAAQKEAQEKYERQCAGQMSLLQRVQSAEKAQKEAEERLKEAHVMDCDCGVVSLRGQSVDPDCTALRTRTETKA
jgi:hypothetical protein